jgi:hypothetical protein
MPGGVRCPPDHDDPGAVAVALSLPRSTAIGTGSPQVIEIVVAHGYRPDVVEAQSGRPIRLVFRRRDDDPCTDRVVFSEPRIERHLAPRATTIVDLPPIDGREIRFTCGMGRYRGRIVLAPPRIPRRPRVAGPARHATRPRTLLPIVIALVLALGLVLIGIVPFSTVLSLGLFGGMMLMHLGGHGGGHAGHDAHLHDGTAEADADRPGQRRGGCH